MNEKDFLVIWLLGVFFITLLVILALPLMFTYAIESGVAIGREL